MGEFTSKHIEGWTISALNDIVVSLESGKRPKGGVHGIQSGVPSIGGEHLNSNGGFNFFNIKYVPHEFADKMSNGIIKINDILVVKDGATSGKTSIVKNDFPYQFAVVNEHVFICRISQHVNPRYIFYYLWSNTGKNQILNDFRGAAQGGISAAFINKVFLPLPPIHEQHRIVAKIEELFSELDNGIESLKAAQQQLKVYRQAVLKWAFEGKLTGSANFEKKSVRLEELCDLITKGTTPAKRDLFQGYGDIPFIKVYNLTFSGKLDFSIDPTFVTQDTHNGFLARSRVIPGDVLMNIVGPPLGKVSIVPDTYSEWNINQAIARFRCKEQLSNKFLAYFLMADVNIEKMKKKAKATAGQFNLTLEICRDIEIPLIPIEEQNRIVQEVESRLSVCDKMEEAVEQSLSKAEALRQSILKTAFEGKLVPQDPNDEPAEKLLERIRVEKDNRKFGNNITKRRANK